MKKPIRIVLISLAVLLVVAQIVPFPPAENPPVGEEIQAPEPVRAILRTSCYDCHSHETTWPWYSSVIPSKWFVRQHVVEGREHLNFSTWGEYPAQRATRKLEEIVEMVEEGEMPMESYLWMHSEAKLTPEQTELLISWARAAGAEMEAGVEEGEAPSDTTPKIGGGEPGSPSGR